MMHMSKTVRWTLYGAALLGGVGLVLYAVFSGKRMELPANVPSGGVGDPNGARVQNRDRAQGVRAELQTFLDWWAANGPFPIVVGVDGGVRTDALKQLSFYMRGLSKAKTLDETPHGHGAALDLWPAGFNPGLDLDKQPAIKAKFIEMGRIAKTMFGFTWGGDWGWDYPHIELKTWRSLPLAGARVHRFEPA